MAPNHHAHHPPFRGATGLLAAASFAVGRWDDAELAVRLTGLHRDDTVVDIGCGPGVALRRAARAGASAIGVDPAPVMHRVGAVVTGSGRRRIDRRVGSAERLPVDEGAATVVWALSSVHHWLDLDAALDEVRRVLRPGGRFLAVEHSNEGHGWTDDQAAAFAALCERHRFVDVERSTHPDQRRPAVAVLARTR